MSFPAPSVSAPSLTNDQLSFQGLTIGPNTPFKIKTLEGLMKSDVRSGNTDRPRARGAFVGTNLLKARTITTTIDVGPPFGSYTNLAGALNALRAALSTEGVTEYPLFLQLPNQPLAASMCRVLKTDAKYDVTADLGSLLQDVPIQFEACDPYFYSAPTQNPQVSLPGPSGGFSFPLSFNLSFGGSATPNQVTITNAGDVPCWPVLQINGPCLNPSISNQSQAGNPTVSLNMQLNAGDTLYVDCDWGSILYLPFGQTVAAPYPQILQAGSTFFGLQPNANVIAFNSQDTSSVAGALNVWWASAYSGLLG